MGALLRHYGSCGRLRNLGISAWQVGADYTKGSGVKFDEPLVAGRGVQAAVHDWGALRGVADHASRLPTRTVEPFSLDHPSCLSLLEDLPLSRWIEERLLPLREFDIT
jgi:hypothetical protein